MKEHSKFKLSYESDGKMGEEEANQNPHKNNPDPKQNEKMYFNITQNSE